MSDKENGGYVLTTWQGFLDQGRNSYDKITATRELTNNIVVPISHNKKYTMQVVVDSYSNEITFTDNFVGFESPEKRLKEAMYFGKSFQNGTIMSKYGSGMKTAINWWGTIQYIKTSNDGEKFYDLLPDWDEELAYFYPVKSTPIQRYDIDKGWVQQLGTGTQIRIKMLDTLLPGRRSWFDNLCDGLEVSYRKYLGKSLDIHLHWLKEDEKKGKVIHYYHRNPIRRKMILSSPPHVMNQEKNPDTNEPYEWIDKYEGGRKIGPKMWTTGKSPQYYSHDAEENKNTGIEVTYQIGTVVTKENAMRHFDKTQDKYYEWELDNPLRHGSKYMGINICVNSIPVMFGGFVDARAERDVFGNVNIISGITETRTKDSLVKDNNYYLFLEDFKEYLRRKYNFKVRTSKNNPKITEAEMENKLLERLKTSSKLRKYLGITATEFRSSQKKPWVLHSGIPDILPIINNKPAEKVIELKLESTVGRIYKAVVQGIAYAGNLNLNEVLIVSLDNDISSELQSKIDIIEQKFNFTIRYENWQKLMEL